jgi:hypothetical protein
MSVAPVVMFLYSVWQSHHSFATYESLSYVLFLLSIVLRMDRLVSSAIQIRTPAGRARGSIFDSCSIKVCQGYSRSDSCLVLYGILIDRESIFEFISELVMSWSCPTLAAPSNQSIKDRMHPCRNKVLRLLSKRPCGMPCCKISSCSLQFCGSHTIFRLEHFASTLFRRTPPFPVSSYLLDIYTDSILQGG